MSEPSIVFHEVNERQGTFTRRVLLLGGVAGLGLAGLAGQLFRLQVVETERYTKLSDSNQFNYRLVPASRGQILDRTGIAIATNRPNFRLLGIRTKDTDVERLITQIGNLVQVDEAKVRQIRRVLKEAALNAPVPLLEDLTWEEFSRVSLRVPELPELSADVSDVRIYPHGGVFSHVLGYVARVSAKDIEEAGDQADPILRYPGFRIGKQGVEKAFETELRGKPGAQKLEVDVKGRVIREDPEGLVRPQSGKPIRLTLDADIQTRALEVFGEDSGAAVMMDCSNGNILCLASAPSFDASQFVRGMSGRQYRALANYERLPLLDKALSGTYPPGSTFKPMTALAALQAGIDPEQKVLCTGGWNFGGRRWACWRKGGHGWQNMHDAIKNSCDVYFYQAGIRAGPDNLEKVSRAFGLGEVFDIGIKGQKAGIVPSRAWKLANRKVGGKWTQGDSANVGIGQGLIAVNALQLCVMVSRLANAQTALQPRLIDSIGTEAIRPSHMGEALPFPAEHLAYVRGGMAAVANDRSGTAYRASQLGLGDIKMAGKTGTAQVRNYAKGASRSNVGIAWRLRDHGLFVAFAPYDKPRFALSVIVQHGSGGAAVAAPKAREIMRVALIKDQELRDRIVRPEGMPTIDGATEAEGAAPEGTVAAPQAGQGTVPRLPEGVIQ